MKYVKLEENIVNISKVGRVFKTDCGGYFLGLEINGHDAYIKYNSILKRDVVFDRLLKLMHVKEL